MTDAITAIEERKRYRISEDFASKRCGYAIHKDGSRCRRFVKNKPRCAPCEALAIVERCEIEKWNDDVRSDTKVVREEV